MATPISLGEFPYHAFNEHDIRNKLNDELKASGVRAAITRITSIRDNVVECETSRGAKYVAILWGPSDSFMGVRGILKVTNKGNRYTYMINGQAGKNTTSIVFNGENGELVRASKEQYTEYACSLYRHVDPIKFRKCVDDRVNNAYKDCN